MTASTTTPTLSDPKAFVAWHRLRGTSWQNLSRMLGRPMDSVRRDFDPGYRGLHAPAQPVCQRPTPARIAALLVERLDVAEADAALVGVLWTAREPMGQMEVQAKAQAWLVSVRDINIGRTSAAFGRFYRRMAVLGIDIAAQPGRGGMALTETGRARLMRLAEAVTP